MDYRQAVAEGRALLARSEEDQWELARLTYRVLVEKRKASILKWAADLRCSPTHAQNLRNVWQRFGSHHDESRTTQSFNEYYTLASVPPERAERIKRAAEKDGVAVGTAHRTGRDRVRDRLDTVREVMRDRRERRRILRDPEFRPIFEREFGPRTPKRQAPPEERLAGRELQLQLVVRLTTLRREFNSILDDMVEVRLLKDIRRSVDEGLDGLGASMDWMRGYVRSGDRSFEDALDSVLADVDADVAVADQAEAPPPPPVKKPRKRPALKPVTEEPVATTEEPVDVPETAGTKRRKPARERPDSTERPRRVRRTA